MTAQPLSFDIRGLASAQENLQLLALPASKRRRLLNTTAKRLRTKNRKRMRQQRNLDGTAYAPRQGGKKTKMMRGLAKDLRVTRLSSEEAVLGWKNGFASRIAREHQDGMRETMTAARLRRLGKTPDYAGAASRAQAKALIKAGYQIRVNKRWKRPPLSWIVSNLSHGQAGLILRKLEDTKTKSSWQIDLPARSVLGAEAQDVRDVLHTVLQQTLNAPR
jgi:phage virion morphogenesis protein